MSPSTVANLCTKTSIFTLVELILCAVFSLGLIVILIAILNCYVNFTEEYTVSFLRWYVAEVVTAVYVANMPLLWPLLRESFSLSSFANS
ncbi:hypothetical protein BDV24DRAFT_158017 [Aspergillus arachidicola]|uniref:Integral membrane protein n=1 Tax=Aspergillus arachidicola TaxID=656916 RepID=A0A5N6YND4_9EURO|nr:hypothetical protein BDV24DRAFT_158017 [Aspergillus arachidicola]